MFLQKRISIKICLASLAFMTALYFSAPLPSTSQTTQVLAVSSQAKAISEQGLPLVKHLKDIFAVLSSLAAFIGLGFGLFQYYKAQIWKRAEFVAEQIKEFEEDPDVKNVMLALDWNERKIKFSDEYTIDKVTEKLLCICLVSGDLSTQKNELMAQKGEAEFSEEESAIRDAFCRFLDYLERFDHFIEAKLITKEELTPYLRYWLNLVGNDNGQIKTSTFYQYLWNFIDYYGYSGVQRLFHRYGYNIKPRSVERKFKAEKDVDKKDY